MYTLTKLPIWTPEFMEYYHIKDPRTWYVKCVHRYLELTQPYKSNIFVRAIDKILRRVVKNSEEIKAHWENPVLV